jgi:hypothetical protein
MKQVKKAVLRTKATRMGIVIVVECSSDDDMLLEVGGLSGKIEGCGNNCEGLEECVAEGNSCLAEPQSDRSKRSPEK